MPPLLAYLLSLSGLALLLYGWDKHQAMRRGARVPEAVLFAAAVLGGSPGALLGMMLFRHKTRKPLFAVGVPVTLLAQVILLAILSRAGRI